MVNVKCVEIIKTQFFKGKDLVPNHFTWKLRFTANKESKEASLKIFEFIIIEILRQAMACKLAKKRPKIEMSSKLYLP